MAKEYSPSPEVEEIALKIIEILKPELEALEIRYVFCSENPKKDGCEVAGLCRKITGLNAYLCGYPDGFFLIETGLPAWNSMSGPQQVAYVHHELCHPAISERGNLALNRHDIEEFNEIAKVHGSYHDGLVIFGDSLKKGDSDNTSRKELIDEILNR